MNGWIDNFRAQDVDGDSSESDMPLQNSTQRRDTAISYHVADLVSRILVDSRFQAAADEEFGELVLRYRFVSVCECKSVAPVAID